jgi:hypothetical protein
MAAHLKKISAQLETEFKEPMVELVTAIDAFMEVKGPSDEFNDELKTLREQIEALRWKYLENTIFTIRLEAIKGALKAYERITLRATTPAQSPELEPERQSPPAGFFRDSSEQDELSTTPSGTYKSRSLPTRRPSTPHDVRTHSGDPERELEMTELVFQPFKVDVPK